MVLDGEYLTPMMVMQLASEMGVSIKRTTVMRAFHPLKATGERRSLTPKLHATVFPGTRKRVCLKEDALRWIEYQREKQGGVQDTIGRRRQKKRDFCQNLDNPQRQCENADTDSTQP